MAKRIRLYMQYIDHMLEEPEANVDYQKEMEKHLIQIAFFVHERFIHLLVTMIFALLTVLSIFYAIYNPEPGIFALVILFFILIIPYISHYYLLENSVQKMYVQYDEMRSRLDGGNSFKI